MENQPAAEASSSILPPELLDALRQPFTPQEVRLRVGKQKPTTENGSWVCVAIPVLSREAIEARLDQLMPGGWSTNASSLVVVEDRVVVSAHVRIGPLMHADYGEVALKRAAVPDEVEELLWSVPEAFEQAFLKVCARFGLGRYLAELAREWVPYDTKHRRIALSSEQQQAHILKLYQQVGISVDSSTTRTSARNNLTENKARTSMDDARKRQHDLAWVRDQCAGKPLQSILQYYQLQRLEEISDKDLASLIQLIHQRRPQRAS